MNRYVMAGLVATIGCSGIEHNAPVEQGSIEHYTADVRGYTSWIEQEADKKSIQTQQILERTRSEDLEPNDPSYLDRKMDLLEAKGAIDNLLISADGAAEDLRMRLVLRRMGSDKEPLSKEALTSLRKRVVAVREQYRQSSGTLGNTMEYFMKEFKDK